MYNNYMVDAIVRSVDKNMIYKVYSINNIETNKIVYIGITRQELKERFAQHKFKKQFSRTEYVINLVKENLSLQEAADLEKILIKDYNLLSEGWNVSPGSINGSSNYHSEEMKKQWSLQRKGKKVSEEHAMKNRVARLGHKNGETWKKAQFESHAKPIYCVETNKVYRSASEAAKELNLQKSKISNCCTGKRTHTGGYHFRFAH